MQWRSALFKCFIVPKSGFLGITSHTFAQSISDTKIVHTKSMTFIFSFAFQRSKLFLLTLFLLPYLFFFCVLFSPCLCDFFW